METKSLLLFILILQLKQQLIFYYLDKSFQEILDRIDNWIYEGSGWIIESIEA